MKISRVEGKAGLGKNGSDKVNKTSDFSTALNNANKDNAEHHLGEMLKDIEKLGKKLTSTRSVEDADSYKRKIQEYLDYVVKNAYVLRKEAGPFNYGVHVRIEVINKKLDELTRVVINEQKDNLELADKISEIRGLLIDVYK